MLFRKKSVGIQSKVQSYFTQALQKSVDQGLKLYPDSEEMRKIGVNTNEKYSTSVHDQSVNKVTRIMHSHVRKQNNIAHENTNKCNTFRFNDHR